MEEDLLVKGIISEVFDWPNNQSIGIVLMEAD
jgi:hypothetical protein